jgi:RNA recognition motif-containing protein
LNVRIAFAWIVLPPLGPKCRPLSETTLKEKHRVEFAIDRRQTMGKRLYVGNLAYGVSSSDLEQLASAHGAVVSAEVIVDRTTGQSKGFGFVEMGSDEEAQAAIDALNGQDHEGRPLRVNEAKPREPRGGGGRGGYGR